MDNLNYQQKYLKYKKKYLDLKNTSMGGASRKPEAFHLLSLGKFIINSDGKTGVFTKTNEVAEFNDKTPAGYRQQQGMENIKELQLVNGGHITISENGTIIAMRGSSDLRAMKYRNHITPENPVPVPRPENPVPVPSLGKFIINPDGRTGVFTKTNEVAEFNDKTPASSAGYSSTKELHLVNGGHITISEDGTIIGMGGSSDLIAMKHRNQDKPVIAPYLGKFIINPDGRTGVFTKTNEVAEFNDKTPAGYRQQQGMENIKELQLVNGGHITISENGTIIAMGGSSDLIAMKHRNHM